MGKRPKPPSQNGGSQVESWQPGKVIRLQMKNFMCVNRVEYNFHPKLNWIIGMVSFEVIYGAQSGSSFSAYANVYHSKVQMVLVKVQLCVPFISFSTAR